MTKLSDQAYLENQVASQRLEGGNPQPADVIRAAKVVTGEMSEQGAIDEINAERVARQSNAKKQAVG